MELDCIEMKECDGNDDIFEHQTVVNNSNFLELRELIRATPSGV